MLKLHDPDLSRLITIHSRCRQTDRQTDGKQHIITISGHCNDSETFVVIILLGKALAARGGRKSLTCSSISCFRGIFTRKKTKKVIPLRNRQAFSDTSPVPSYSQLILCYVSCGGVDRFTVLTNHERSQLTIRLNAIFTYDITTTPATLITLGDIVICSKHK